MQKVLRLLKKPHWDMENNENDWTYCKTSEGYGRLSRSPDLRMWANSPLVLDVRVNRWLWKQLLTLSLALACCPARSSKRKICAACCELVRKNKGAQAMESIREL